MSECSLEIPCLQARQAGSQLHVHAQLHVQCRANEPAALKAHAQPGWGCPKCRHQYSYGHVPSSYTCFCGKLEDLPFDPWMAPHSCGQECGRTLHGCSHTCTLLCHPGPCPPCPRQVCCLPRQKDTWTASAILTCASIVCHPMTKPVH